MKSTAKAKAIIKLLKQGYSPSEITQRIDASYNYAWKLQKDLKAAAQEALGIPCTGECPPKHEPEVEAKAGEYIEVEGAKSAQEIDAILNARASSYGSFKDVAEVAQRLKHTAQSASWQQGKVVCADQAEALDMIFSKIARIVNGDPNHVDSWVDIAGYAQLVADRLQGKVR